MGQKTNPVGLRLGLNTFWDTTWCSPNSNYGSSLVMDTEIKKFLREVLLKRGLFPSKIHLKKSNNHLALLADVFPTFDCYQSSTNGDPLVPQLLSDDYSLNLRDLHTTISQISGFPEDDISISLSHTPCKQVTNTIPGGITNVGIFPGLAEPSSDLILDYIICQIELPRKQKDLIFRRGSLKKSLTTISSLLHEKFESVRGIRIRCSGRINGAERSQTVNVSHGATLLHTVSSRVDFQKGFARTMYGVLGIKVWICFY